MQEGGRGVSGSGGWVCVPVVRAGAWAGVRPAVRAGSLAGRAAGGAPSCWTRCRPRMRARRWRSTSPLTIRMGPHRSGRAGWPA
eukprot:scaffold14295_cov116-Isochrysis_galbana.AAC.7